MDGILAQQPAGVHERLSLEGSTVRRIVKNDSDRTLPVPQFALDMLGRAETSQKTP